MNLSLSLLNWSAWAPGLECRADWQAWARGDRALPESDGQPALAFVPAMARRRMSRVTRMAMQAAEDARGPARAVPTVFASRHGELARSFGILQAVTLGEPVSPADFSVSVHNSAAGLYGIQQQDRSPSTTVSAGPDTLGMAFVECHAQLQASAAEALLVLADEPVPALYAPFIDEAEWPFALALLLGRAQAGHPQLALQRTGDGSADDSLPQGMQLARLLCAASGTTRMRGWQWTLEPA